MSTLAQVVEDEVDRLINDAMNEGIALTDNEIACFRGGLTRGLEVAQQAHDAILADLGISGCGLGW